MKSRSTVFCHVTTRTKTNNLTVHAHTLIAPKWSSPTCVSNLQKIPRLRWKTDPVNGSPLSAADHLCQHTETFPLLAFSCTPFNWALVLILQQKGLLAYEVMLFSPSWKCYLNLDILIKSYIDLNIMTEKRYLCSLQQCDTSQHFGLQKIKLVLYDCVTVNPKKRLDFVVWCHKERHANQFSHAQSVLQLH